MINFNKGTRKMNEFLGAEKKMTIEIDSVVYMVKMPDPIREKRLRAEISYKNNQFSEHIGCAIFRTCGIESQKTVLGTFVTPEGKEKVVVGCEVFTNNKTKLIEMKALANATVGSDRKMENTIEDVYYTIENEPLIQNKKKIIIHFWKIFIIDMLIGNTDRHLGNWGFIVTEEDVQFAPIYDCGSSLGALLDDEMMAEHLAKNPKLSDTEKSTFSIYKMDGKRISHIDIFKNPPEDLITAIKELVPKVDMEKIDSIVDSVDQMSETRKKYMKQAINLRYTDILRPAYKQLFK